MTGNGNQTAQKKMVTGGWIILAIYLVMGIFFCQGLSKALCHGHAQSINGGGKWRWNSWENPKEYAGHLQVPPLSIGA